MLSAHILSNDSVDIGIGQKMYTQTLESENRNGKCMYNVEKEQNREEIRSNLKYHKQTCFQFEW